VDLEALRAVAPEAVEMAEAVEFKPEEVEAILSLAFLELSRWILRRMEREEVTLEEADRWARCTRIVYWRYLQRTDAATTVWVVLTAGILLNKKKLPKKEEKKS
jgi:hypothetical protein